MTVIWVQYYKHLLTENSQTAFTSTLRCLFCSSPRESAQICGLAQKRARTKARRTVSDGSLTSRWERQPVISSRTYAMFTCRGPFPSLLMENAPDVRLIMVVDPNHTFILVPQTETRPTSSAMVLSSLQKKSSHLSSTTPSRYEWNRSGASYS